MTDMTVATPIQALTKKDFESGLDVRWCPGCGDYVVLAQITKLMPKLGIPREDFAFVSGIGCSSRFPYYVQTYGLHTIHGRALAIATGLKITRPDLSVWVVTGDGDALAIGGNHFIHAVRRNIGVKIILLNNRIYGLTKGQYSPTSELGKKTKTSPLGNIDQPFSPVALALGAGATFAARCIDGDQAMMAAILERAAKHEGTAFVEILQNCVVFNDGAFDMLSDKATRDDTRLVMEHGKPLIFGKERNKGIRLRGMDMEVVTIGENGVTEADILVHDENAAHSGLAFSLGQFESPDFPVPMGVFRDVNKPSYESLSTQLSESARAAKGRGDLQRLLNAGETWTIK
ncbi:MAG: 2-oxoacid:ferredoxin oxidoreductase subunit beta [Rhodocyclales bacterium]|nr:2-oxoacid:ferredoxin oxidoreductase subunit beta [Rhodocyclales bacterium]